MKVDDASDTDLLARWRRGESAAGERLFSRHFDRVERFFLNKVDRQHVPDLVQETFMACVTSRDHIREGACFPAYLLGIARHVLCAFLRRKHGIQTEVLDQSIASLSPSPSSVLADHDEQRALLEALRSIAVRYQVVLEHYYWEDLGTTEISQVLAIPEGTARTWLRRARLALEAKLATTEPGRFGARARRMDLHMRA